LRASSFEVTLGQHMVGIEDKFFIATTGNELKMHLTNPNVEKIMRVIHGSQK
jgi:hypothetical protein